MAILLTPTTDQDHTIVVALLRAELADVYALAAHEVAEREALGRAVQSLLSQLALHEANEFVDEFANAYARERRVLQSVS